MDNRIPAMIDDIGLLFESAVFWSTSSGNFETIFGEPSDSIQIQRNIETTDRGYTVRLRVRNISGNDILLRSMELLRIRSAEDLDMKAPWESIQVYTHGRNKNDIPSVVKLEINEVSQNDALSSMRESGNSMEHDKSGNTLQSDTMTLLHSGKKNLFLAYPEGDRLFCRTRICLDGSYPALVSGCTPMIVLGPGQELESEPLCISAGEDWHSLTETWAEEKAAHFGVPAQRRPAPVVYCTWYYYGLTVSLDDVNENLEEIRKQKIPYDVFQIDEGWEVTLGEWRPNHRFPIAMKDLADRIRSFDMTPGIWTSPFIAHETASIWQEHPDWKLCDRDGKPLLFPMNGTVYQVLDITIPAVISYIRELYRTLTFDWGYRYHKLDFTRAAVQYPEAVRYDMTIPLPQAYRRAMQAVREGIGEDSYLLICGGLYDAAIGIADCQRTGADVLAKWPLTSTIKQNLLRWYMNKWWDNDADCLILRRQKEMTRNLNLTYGLLTDDEIRTNLVNQYLSGGLFSQTERLSIIDADRLWQIAHVIPTIPLEAVPELFTGERQPSRIYIKGKNSFLRELILINWSDTEMWSPSIRPEEIALYHENDDKSSIRAERYLSVEFYGGQYHITAADAEITVSPIPPHSAEVIRVHSYDPEKPYIVASQAHYSLGEETDELSCNDNTLTFAITSRFPVPLEYTILLPEDFRTEDGESIIRFVVPSSGYHRFTSSVTRQNSCPT